MHIVLDVSKSYLLFLLVLMKDIQCYIEFPWNLNGLYQIKIVIDSVIGKFSGKR